MSGKEATKEEKLKWLIESLQRSTRVPPTAGTGEDYRSLGGIPMSRRKAPATNLHLDAIIENVGDAGGSHTSSLNGVSGGRGFKGRTRG